LLDDAALELQLDYEMFLLDYNGSYLVDAYIGFAEMLRQFSPWRQDEWSGLNDLTLGQAYFAWAWNQNNSLKHFASGEDVANGWNEVHARDATLVAAVSAAKSLCHAKNLIGSGRKLITDCE